MNPICTCERENSRHYLSFTVSAGRFVPVGVISVSLATLGLRPLETTVSSALVNRMKFSPEPIMTN